MNRDDIIRMARDAGFAEGVAEIVGLEGFERFAALVAAQDREKVARWMMERGYATGHGDTIQDLIKEVEWQVQEKEREECAKVCEDSVEYAGDELARQIRARGKK